jgi:hypothetical protein
MSASDDRRETVRKLLRSDHSEEQAALREGLGGDGYYRQIRSIYLENPFFKLVDDEVAHFASRNEDDPLDALVLARDAASKSRAPKYAVFCMPKSGSSFVQSALQTALELPFVSMTSVGGGRASSRFGMNGREQEVDELAIVKSILGSPDGFVTQVHTRCTPYLARQLRFYGIAPIVTIRNILDCIVSFDEMMVTWRRRRGANGWMADAQFALPANFADLDDQARYDLLARSYGTWLIAFYLSWRRCTERKLVDPIFLRYEVDVLDPPEFVRKMAAMTRMDEAQIARLRDYAETPDRERSRFSVGVKGRGARIDDAIVESLLEYARRFGDELPEPELRYLIR